MKKQVKKNWVSASDAGRAAFCPRYLVLKYSGLKPSHQAEIARKKGNASHHKLNILAEDKRCYIASYLYGIDDDRTRTLRLFRDRVLVSNHAGNTFIYLYYKLSPTLVRLSGRYPIIKGILRVSVDFIVKQVKVKEGD